jgi:hypothetical protein
MAQLAIDLPPRARKSDPDTSHRAASRVSGVVVDHRNRIMAVLVGRMTIKEIARAIGSLDHVQVARRMPELEEQGRARPTDERRDGCRCWERCP